MRKNLSSFVAFTVLIISTINSFAGDGYLTSLSLSPYIKTNTDYTLSVQVKNKAGSSIPSFKLLWKLDNGTANSSSLYTITGGLPTTAYVPLAHTNKLNVATQGKHSVKIWVEATGETNYSNDTITFNFTSINNYATKVALLEEFTATWCQHCPSAGVVTDTLSPKSWVAVARFHDNDELSFTDGVTHLSSYNTTGIPAAVVDMGVMGAYSVNIQYPSWGNDVYAQAGISPVSLTNILSVNSSARVVTVKLTANFKYAEDGNYFMNAYILEDGIVLPQKQEDLSVINNYVHNNVVRVMLGGANGTGGIIPSSPVTNTDYSKTYTFTVPSDWNLQKLNIVGVVFKKEGSKTGAINSTKGSFYNTTGVKDLTEEKDINVYPIPFADKFTISLPKNNISEVSISIFSVDGKMVFNQEHGSVNNNLLDVDLRNKNMVPGFYNLLIRTKNDVYSKKLIKY